MAIKEFNENMKISIKTFKSIWNVLTDPHALFLYIQSSVQIACIIIVCVGVIAYAIGYKKANKWGEGSIAAYIIVKMLSVVI